jgi:hypothetical protein
MNNPDFYRPIHIENLKEIQEEVMNLLPEKLLTYSSLTYIENNKEIFLSSNKLSDYLKSKKIYDTTGAIAVNITKGFGAGTYHVDSGPYKHSLNIPISGCENTWINFFKVNSDYTTVTVENDGLAHRYFRYTEDQCELIYEAETSVPYLLGTKTPHRVINKSNNTRVMLLVRLFSSPYINEL